MLRTLAKKRLTCGLLIWVTTITSYAQTVVIQDGTPVRLRIGRNVSSADAQVGETIDFEVLEDILVSGATVIPKGGVALGTVTVAQEKRRMGRAGKLGIVIDHARLASGDKVALRAAKETTGGSNAGKVTGAVVATSIVFFPAAPLFLLMHGKDMTIPKGTEITAYVNGDMRIDTSRLAIQQAAPTPSSAAIPMQVSTVPSQPSVAPSQGSLTRPTAGMLTTAEIRELKAFGFSDSLIVTRIDQASAVQMDTDTKALVQLKNAGLSDAVISAMLKKAARP